MGKQGSCPGRREPAEASPDPVLTATGLRPFWSLTCRLAPPLACSLWILSRPHKGVHQSARLPNKAPQTRQLKQQTCPVLVWKLEAQGQGVGQSWFPLRL